MTVLLQLILASASPRRRELLGQIGVAFRVQVADVYEQQQPGEKPLAYVQRVALDKARAVCAQISTPDQLPVLGADTEVVLGDEVLGKPRNREHGLAMLERLSGRSHQVLTAVALIHHGREQVRVSSSTVTFRATTAQERELYWATGEPADKAGAYAIQGRGAVFIRHLEGSFSGVMGLPVFETAELLRECGISALQI